MTFFDDPVAAAALLPPFLLPLLIFASALLEYIFPPYWGDMFMLVGFFLAGQGAVPPLLVFASAFLGSVVGSVIAYSLGQRYGLALVRRALLRRRRKSRNRERVRQLYARYGERVLIANRFLPVVRGLLLFAAGAMRLRFVPSIFYSALSNVAWIGLLMAVGMLTAGTWEQIQTTFRHYSLFFGLAVLVSVALWIAVVAWRGRAG